MNFELPEHLKRKPGNTIPCFSDNLSRRIVLLGKLHPEIDLGYSDLRKVSREDRSILLAKIEKELGI